jgi:hypothetical protein
MNTTEVIKAELSSDCSCEEYDEETGESKLDEQGEVVMSIVCFGCYDDDKTYIQDEIITTWVERNEWQMDTPILVNGKRMTWQGIGGHAHTTPERLIDTLSLNGDFILRFTLTGNTLEVVRASHDEFGALFAFDKIDESELEDD